MNEHMATTLRSTVDLIASTLDTNPTAWRDHLQAIRNITVSLEFLDSAPDEARKQWQLPLLRVFQRVAFADAYVNPGTTAMITSTTPHTLPR
jgi:hypothetical protein